MDLVKNEKIIKFDVDEACDGIQAVECYKKNLKELCEDRSCIRNYKLVIMDLGMPLKNGFQASKEILDIQEKHKQENISEKRINAAEQFFESQECEIVALTAFTD